MGSAASTKSEGVAPKDRRSLQPRLTERVLESWVLLVGARSFVRFLRHRFGLLVEELTFGVDSVGQSGLLGRGPWEDWPATVTVWPVRFRGLAGGERRGAPQPQPSKVEGWWDGGSAAGMARPARSRGAHAHAAPSDRQGKGNGGRPR